MTRLSGSNTQPPQQKYEVLKIFKHSQYVLDRFYYSDFQKAQDKYCELLATVPDTIDVELNTISE